MNTFSLVVLTYNQSTMIAECLDSILSQNIRSSVELIISDDCSTDSTSSIIDSWVQKHKKEFQNLIYVKQSKNLGISENHKYGISLAQGSVIKYIGGDDFLLPCAIQTYIDFFDKHPDIDCVCSDILVLSYENNFFSFRGVRPLKKHIKYFEYSAEKQFDELCKQNFIPAPGLCFRSNVAKKSHFMKSSFMRFEDWPTWLDLTRNNYKFRRIPSITIIWRRHNKAISENPFRNKDTCFYKNELETINKYIEPFQKNKIIRWDFFFRKKQLKIIIKGNFSTSVRIRVFIYNLLRPYYYINKIKSLC